MKETLLEKLKAYGETDMYPMHMPGHKRRVLPKELGGIRTMDITEIEGFDNLHDARGIIREAEEFAADLCGAEETAFVVNGSSAGILSAITAVCRPGDKIAVSRACHKSVYHAMEINRLEPVYIYPHINPDYGIFEGISGEDAEKVLSDYEDIAAVMVVSPTYDGVVSDIRGICRAAHSRGIPVIVDEAHGAHFHFSGYFPESAVDAGADIVIQSTHKTLPALTQTSVLHYGGGLIDRARLRHMLTVFQSSSPSYILMGSIDGCMHLLAERGEKMFREYTNLLDETRRSLQEMKMLHLAGRGDLRYPGSVDFDRSKIIVSSAGTCVTGRAMYQALLEDYHIQMEMTAADYVLGISSVCDDRAGMRRVSEAFLDMDRRIMAGDPKLAGDGKKTDPKELGALRCAEIPRMKYRMPIGEAGWMKTRTVPLDEAAGRISASFVYLYPPGVPLVAPGEEINRPALDVIRRWIACGLEVSGIDEGRIIVVK